MVAKSQNSTINRKHFLLGVTFVVGFFIIVGAVVFFGSNKLLRTGVAVETYIDDSVQGIEIGTVVKYRGVRIGLVDEIAFVIDEYPEAELNWQRYVMIRFKIDSTQVLTIDTLGELIQKGLRAKILPQGITGLSYIELDYVQPEELLNEIYPNWQPNAFYIPSSRGFISAISRTIRKLSSNLDNADLDVTFQRVNRILKEISVELEKSEIGKVAVNVDGLITELRVTNRILQNILSDNKIPLQESIRSFRKTSRNLEEITERAKKYPSYVLFGDPPPKPSKRR